MKKLLLAALLSCVAWAHAGPIVSCLDLEKDTGLQPGQLFTQNQIDQISTTLQAKEIDVVLGLFHFCGIGVPKNVEKGLNIWKSAALNGQINAIRVLVGFYAGAFGDAPDQERAVEWLTFGAKAGIAEAQDVLGAAYWGGELVVKNMAEAERWLLKSAAQGYAQAQVELGMLYSRERKYREALPWLNLGAAQGNAEAQFQLGQLYFNGLGLEINHSTAMKWWRAAAEQKHAAAQCSLGVGYDTGSGVVQDHVEAFKWYLLAAEQGYSQALETVAKAYEFGLAVQQDKAMAFQWWKKLADQKKPMAQLRVGWMYVGGVGVARDEQEGIQWFRQASEQDMAEAYVSLAQSYEYGLGTPVDLEVARYFRLKKSEQVFDSRQVDSCAFIGDSLLNETDSMQFRLKGEKFEPEILLRQAEQYLEEKKPKEALCKYQRAADTGLAKGLSALGNAYLAKRGIPFNPVLGIYYLRVAAEQTDMSAKVHLATLYQKGEIVPKSAVAAYALNFVTAWRSDELDSLLESYHPEVEGEMSQDQILHARKLIREMSMPSHFSAALDRATAQ